jgi:hypothetical protein
MDPLGPDAAQRRLNAAGGVVMIRHLSFLVAALALFADPALAQNCTCTKYESVAQFIQFNDVIFKGKALSSRTERGSTTTTFEVLERLKGEPGARVAVMHPAPGTNCGGVAFKPGEIVLVVAQGMVDDLGTTGCQIEAYTEAQIRAALK